MATQLEINKEKAKAKSEITKSIRDLLSFNITVPLGNPAYKLIHTNKFISTVLPEDFVLANFGVIGQKLNSEDTRYSSRDKSLILNNWYVEAVTITNDGTNAKMELTLNPFASNMASYKDARLGFEKAYNDAVNQQSQQASQSANNTLNNSSGNNTVKTATKKTTGSSKLDKVVDNAIKGKNKALDKAKAIDKAFKNHVIYSFYKDAQKTGGKKSKFESAWNNGHLNCADGANLLCAMFIYAGLSATIIHTKHPKAGHYIVRLNIGGKYYYTDNAASTGKHTTRAFGKVWEGITKGTNKGTIVE